MQFDLRAKAWLFTATCTLCYAADADMKGYSSGGAHAGVGGTGSILAEMVDSAIDAVLPTCIPITPALLLPSNASPAAEPALPCGLLAHARASPASSISLVRPAVVPICAGTKPEMRQKGSEGAPAARSSAAVCGCAGMAAESDEQRLSCSVLLASLAVIVSMAYGRSRRCNSTRAVKALWWRRSVSSVVQAGCDPDCSCSERVGLELTSRFQVMQPAATSAHNTHGPAMHAMETKTRCQPCKKPCGSFLTPQHSAVLSSDKSNCNCAQRYHSTSEPLLVNLADWACAAYQ